MPLLRSLLAPLAPPLCVGCRSYARAEPFCAECRAQLAWLPPEPVACGPVAAWAPLAYQGPAAALARSLKFDGVVSAAEAMAAQIAANAPPGLLAGRVLVPVPLHPARRRRRGYNQARLLADALAARASLPLADVLERFGPPGTQVGRGRGERLSAAAVGVRVRDGWVAPARAVLVDDVITTGATVGACARALLSAGSAEVVALAYARTPGR